MAIVFEKNYVLIVVIPIKEESHLVRIRPVLIVSFLQKRNLAISEASQH